MVLLMGLWFTVVIFLLGIPRDQCDQIIGGKESVPHSRPFMAYIKGSASTLCGGSLIRPNWVLTAAHCIIQQNAEVILGIHSENDTTKQVFKVNKCIRHWDFNSATRENDIMLLKLNRQATLNKNVALVHFPWVYGDLMAGTQCLVAGWGITQSGSKKASDVLREVNVTVFARSICNDKNHYNSRPEVKLNMVCAGDNRGGKDSCIGDSGGPLMCNGKQRGIVSFGRGCGNPRYPGIYTLLTYSYFQWINRVIQVNS